MVPNGGPPGLPPSANGNDIDVASLPNQQELAFNFDDFKMLPQQALRKRPAHKLSPHESNKRTKTDGWETNCMPRSDSGGEDTGPAEQSLEAFGTTCNQRVEEVTNDVAGPGEHLTGSVCHLPQFEGTITSVFTNFTSSVVDQEHAIEYLIKLLKSPSPNVREQAAWCLGNIASDRPEYRDILLEKGALEALIHIVQHPENDSHLAIVTRTISILCRGTPQPNRAAVYAVIPALNNLVCNSTDDDIVTVALWALADIANGENIYARVDEIIKADPAITRKLVQLVDSGKETVIAGALRVLGSFVSGNEEQTQAVIDAGVLGVALNVINGQKKTLRKEMCWLLSNIAAGTQKQVRTLTTTTDLAAKLVAMSVQAEWETRKEAIRAVSNIFSNGNDLCTSLLVNCQGIQAMVAALDEPEMILVALDAIENILDIGEWKGYGYAIFCYECGGIDKLEELQNHMNEEVYEKALQIIDRYFGEEEATNVNPPTEVENELEVTISSSQREMECGDSCGEAWYAPDGNSHTPHPSDLLTSANSIDLTGHVAHFATDYKSSTEAGARKVIVWQLVRHLHEASVLPDALPMKEFIRLATESLEQAPEVVGIALREKDIFPGKHSQQPNGNALYKEKLRMFAKEFQSSDKRGKKSLVTTMVQSIMEEGFRFLREPKKGEVGWQDMNMFDVVRKVRKGLYNLTSPSKNIESRQKEPNFEQKGLRVSSRLRATRS